MSKPGFPDAIRIPTGFEKEELKKKAQKRALLWMAAGLLMAVIGAIVAVFSSFSYISQWTVWAEKVFILSSIVLCFGWVGFLVGAFRFIRIK